MSTSGTAHLRRCRSLLQCLPAGKQEAVVYLGAERLGTTGEAHFTWKLCGRRIRVEFAACGRRIGYWLSTVGLLRNGLKLTLDGGSKARSITVSLLWGPADDPAPAPPTDFWKVVRAWLLERYPGLRIRSVVKRTDRANTISGSFLRVLFEYRGRRFALLACDPAEARPDGHAVLTQAFLWQETLSRRSGGPAVPLVLIPQSLAGIVSHCHRLTTPQISVWEIDDSEGGRIEPVDAPEPPVENRDFRWPVLGPFRWSDALSRVIDLAPELIRRYPRFDDYDSLRLYGLEFARAVGEKRDRILFGMGPNQMQLTDENFDLLRSLVSEILYFRRADSPSHEHPYYRMQAERWLESLILEDAGHLFPELAPEAVYSQIPVYLGNDPGRVDVLAVDRQGTLVVMELKVAVNPNLPLQALDYWGRVLQHNNQGDFARRGYFSELRLTRRQPVIYLVAPVFSFHDTTERLLRYLDESLEIWKIALNEDWRSGVRVLDRTLLKCGRET